MRFNSLRATILMACPRIVRIGLNPSVATSAEPAAIAEDIVRLRPAFLPQARMWLKSATGRTSLARPWPEMQNAHGHTSKLVRGLDKLAAKSPVASELADSLVLMTAAAYELLSAARLTNRLWHSVGQLAELRCAVRIEEWRPLPDTIFDNLPPEVVLDQQGVDDLIDKVRRILGEIESETTDLAIGMSLLAAGNSAPENNCLSLAELARQMGTSPGLMRNLNGEASIPSSVVPPVVANQSDRPSKTEVPQRADAVLVCPAITGSKAGKDAVKPFVDAIGARFPLIKVSALAPVRQKLISKFPYAEHAATRVLTDLTTKQFVHFSPILLVGPPGSGKSTFVRALAEQLKVGLMRVDGANDFSSGFSGTERRWSTSEPCRPFMAVARFRQANPIVLVDEIDKATSRQDYGRLWDSMLQFMESETSSRFPDPCLQVELDLRHVSIIATANEVNRLPGPLLDRFRIIEFPKPELRHLEALVPDILRTIALDQGIHPRFMDPLDQIEVAVLARRWRGGSIRPLKRAIEAILRARECSERRTFQ